MDATRFIASRLRFKGKLAMSSIAISFLVMIIAVSISSGFRKEIRNGVSSFTGDIQLSPTSLNILDESDPISSSPSYLSALDSLEGVAEITPVIYRAGIVKNGDNIHGVLFKGVPGQENDSTSLGVRIPSRLSELLGLKTGDRMLSYFIGEKIKVRKFLVTEVYPSLIEADNTILVYASLKDMQRLNAWDDDEVSALEITLDDKCRTTSLINEMNAEVGSLALFRSDDWDDATVATSIVQRYPQLFDWLNLIDFNVFFILVLMTVVAGFNMISGLLILLFRSISTIGILKSMGMTDKDISTVFLRVSSVLVLKGMAIGNALALIFCAVQGETHFLTLDPKNYFVSFVPVSVNLPYIFIADLLSFVGIMLLLLIPCKFISKVDPARTVRAQ